MSGGYQFHETDGNGLTPWIDPLGALRIEVFREFPYLYEGSIEYEREYLATYRKSPDARVFLVTGEGGKLVGATTCVPLVQEIDEFKKPFIQQGIDLTRVLYFGESIILPGHRGKGLGKEFFSKREAHACRLGLTVTAFCAVDRPDDHPLRPAAYRPLDSFWQERGYQKQPGMLAILEWKETGEADESPKSLTFWLKERQEGSGLVDHGAA